MKNRQNLKLGDVPLDTPRNIQDFQASKLGDARGTPASSIKSTRSFFSALYFYCFMRYVLFLERLRFLFYVFFCFSVINVWITAFLCGRETLSAVLHHIYFGVRHAPLYCIMFTLE